MVDEMVAFGQTDSDWMQFEHDLADTLQGLGEDDFLVVSAKHRQCFVQFAGQGRFGMRVEAVSNNYIQDPQARLSPVDVAHMGRLGWNPPTGSADAEMAHELGPDGSPNFFVDAPYPVDFDELARRTVQTLRHVYRIDHPGWLQYQAFTSHGEQIRFPGLRIKRETAS